MITPYSPGGSAPANDFLDDFGQNQETSEWANYGDTGFRLFLHIALYPIAGENVHRTCWSQRTVAGIRAGFPGGRKHCSDCMNNNDRPEAYQDGTRFYRDSLLACPIFEHIRLNFNCRILSIEIQKYFTSAIDNIHSNILQFKNAFVKAVWVGTN